MTTPIGIPWGTRLVHIDRVSGGWYLWTGVDDLSKPVNKRRGSFLYLHDNGSVTRYTIHPDGTETEQRIKSCDEESSNGSDRGS